jgi:predicted nucleic acid-binding protein
VIVVSDSSPLITLARAQQLNLLREFYGQITIPDEVHSEVIIAGAGLPGPRRFGQPLGFRSK